MRKPPGSIVEKQAASARPGFHPSAAAQSTAIEISFGRILRMRIWNGRTARDCRTWRAINGLAERTCSPHPVRCEWHWGELDRILPCDEDGLFVSRWHDQMAPYRDARLLRAASRVGAACWDVPQKS